MANIQEENILKQPMNNKTGLLEKFRGMEWDLTS